MSPALLNGDSSTHGVGKHQYGFGTRAIHVGSEPNAETGAVIPPISLSTTYKQDAVGKHKVSKKPRYMRFLGGDQLIFVVFL